MNVKWIGVTGRIAVRVELKISRNSHSQEASQSFCMLLRKIIPHFTFTEFCGDYILIPNMVNKTTPRWGELNKLTYSILCTVHNYLNSDI